MAQGACAQDCSESGFAKALPATDTRSWAEGAAPSHPDSLRQTWAVQGPTGPHGDGDGAAAVLNVVFLHVKELNTSRFQLRHQLRAQSNRDDAVPGIVETLRLLTQQ